jgi:hypothetical protein
VCVRPSLTIAVEGPYDRVRRQGGEADERRGVVGHDLEDQGAIPPSGTPVASMSSSARISASRVPERVTTRSRSAPDCMMSNACDRRAIKAL